MCLRIAVCFFLLSLFFLDEIIRKSCSNQCLMISHTRVCIYERHICIYNTGASIATGSGSAEQISVSCWSTAGTAVEKRGRAVFQEGCGNQQDGDHMFLTGGKHLLGRGAGDSASSEVSCEVPCFAMGFSRIKRLVTCCKLPTAEGIILSQERRNCFSDFSWWCYQ